MSRLYYLCLGFVWEELRLMLLSFMFLDYVRFSENMCLVDIFYCFNRNNLRDCDSIFSYFEPFYVSILPLGEEDLS